MKKLLLALLLTPLVSQAREKVEHEYDTIPCKVECIQKFVVKKTMTAKGEQERIHCVYISKNPEIAEMIPMSQTTHKYILECGENGVPVHLGIRLCDGEVHSIVRIKTKIKL